ncbi:MAG TPA: flagellar biosynthesis protein FlhF [Tepidisphaeraceae bacterium]|nr:flagellar biosynthesis protein FlhF [Tepidisphaeraceae bacterium]
MNLRTFSAPTFAAAMALVKGEMGADAVILHTRTVPRRKWMGMRRGEVVEITAGTGLNVATRRRPAQAQQSQQTQSIGRPGAGTYGRDGRPAPVAKPAPQPAQSSAAPGQGLLETPAANRAMMMSISSEVRDLRGLLENLVRQTRKDAAPAVPEHLFDHYTHLIQNQVAEELATDMVRQLGSYRAEQLSQTDFVREKLVEQVERMIPATGGLRKGANKVGPHVVALIGPTGVGKTTTLAKLAANLKLRENRKVGLITLDTYRIAAIDQLRRYAELIGSPLKVCNSADDVAEAVAGMRDCDFVLVDTAGRSPADTLKLNELRGMLEAARPDEVHLVLASTASQTCIEFAIERFGQVRVDKIIFTKLDEAVHVGVVLNVVRKVNKALSYVTTGQNVPDDIEVGRGSRLAQMLLGTAGGKVGGGSGGGTGGGTAALSGRGQA